MELFKSGKRKKIIYISIVSLLFILGTIFLLVFLNKSNSNSKFLEKIGNLKTEVYNSMPSEVNDNISFTYQFTSFPEATVVYKSLNEDVITSEGKVNKRETEVLVWIEAEITYMSEVFSVKKDIKVKAYSVQEMQIVLSSQIKIPSRNYTYITLPTYLEKYKCKITYLPYAQKVQNGSFVDETSISIQVSDGLAVIEADIQEEEIRCFIVAIFEFGGNTFRKNYPVYTLVNI